MKNGEGVVIPGAIPVVCFTSEERLERHDCVLPIDRCLCCQSACELSRRRRPFPRRQYSALAKQKYDPRGLLNPGKMISFRRGGGAVKTWIPDARNFAYLTWKQVDALPRESTLLVLPTAAIEQHGHHLAARDRYADQQPAARQRVGAEFRSELPIYRAAACLLWQEQ